MKKLTLAFLGLAAALVLSGCGIRGDLERPPPFWGADERSNEERAHETEDASEEDEAATTANGETR
ncbi:lipoprotein [Oceanicaulis sp. MMSF_3324]|uniref:LPS translocon maturation chaperone LptM n=1 Tax=Oceanicaulis sp. MMSF_3324 TaxID=3046702 RepID=UPI00273E9C01|nr:lipoprotein [Oceanicaulis sp. MMSF_3324]